MRRVSSNLVKRPKPVISKVPADCAEATLAAVSSSTKVIPRIRMRALLVQDTNYGRGHRNVGECVIERQRWSRSRREPPDHRRTGKLPERMLSHPPRRGLARVARRRAVATAAVLSAELRVPNSSRLPLHLGPGVRSVRSNRAKQAVSQTPQLSKSRHQRSICAGVKLGPVVVVLPVLAPILYGLGGDAADDLILVALRDVEGGVAATTLGFRERLDDGIAEPRLGAHVGL